jgi:hypothetical protein
MKRGKLFWGVVIAIAGFVVIALSSKPIPAPKARAQRIMAVNSLHHVSFMYTNMLGDVRSTNQLPVRVEWNR